MRVGFSWVAGAVTAAAFALIGAASASAQTAATVTRVVDGDTIEVTAASGAPLTVELIGIDAPELATADGAECGAVAAADALRSLVEGRAVVLVTDPVRGQYDAAGRTLAYVSVAGVDAGKQQLLFGHATVLPNNPPFQRYQDYVAAQQSAQGAGAGAWRVCRGEFHLSLPLDQVVEEESSRAESAERFVRRYYFLLNERRFSQAWNMLSAGVRRKLGSYAGWRRGFRRMRGTKVNDVSVGLANGKASVRIAIRATDRDACNGRSVKRYFRGRWVLNRRGGWWTASAITMRKVGGGSVRLLKSECAPKRPARRPSPSAPSTGGGGGGGGGGGCHPSYSPCVPNDRDYDCPELNGPYTVTGPDEYRLDGDNDGVGCE